MTTEPRRYTAVIVDDEPAGRQAVRHLLAEVASVDVVAEAANGTEAIELLHETRPDLLFLDIQMPDRDGFQVLDALEQNYPRGIVLVTAHSEYAHRAFEVHAVDYVLKPFGRPRFMAAVERAIQRLEADEALGLKETLRSLVQSLGSGATGTIGQASAAEPGGRIGVRVGSRTVLVSVADIDWIEADGDVLRIHEGERLHLVGGPLKSLEANLQDGRFLRIHRSVVVNLDRVAVLNRERDGSGSVTLRSGVSLRVARNRWPEVVGALGLDWGG